MEVAPGSRPAGPVGHLECFAARDTGEIDAQILPQLAHADLFSRFHVAHCSTCQPTASYERAQAGDADTSASAARIDRRADGAVLDAVRAIAERRDLREKLRRRSTPDARSSCVGCSSERITGRSSRSSRAAPRSTCGSAPSTSILMKRTGRRSVERVERDERHVASSDCR